jgi:hypothetical protein
MGEFWMRRPDQAAVRRIKLPASIAHLNAKAVVGAEAYTGGGALSRWLEFPYSMKAQGDWMYTKGLNRFIFHRYAQQPHPDAVPGMTMGPHGWHFDRTNTWSMYHAASRRSSRDSSWRTCSTSRARTLLWPRPSRAI